MDDEEPTARARATTALRVLLAKLSARAKIPLDPDCLESRDPDLVETVIPIARFANRHYLRLKAEGFANLEKGPVLYVANHNGGIAGPDISCTMGSLWESLGARVPLYGLAHDFVMRHIPRAGAVLQAFGAIRAKPENALRALQAGAQVLVYPGGDLEAYRHARRGDRVVLGPCTGFVRVAQAAGVPIVPIVAQGAHRSAYIFSEGEVLARLFRLKRWARLERFPLAFALPWGLALGPWVPYLPLPFPIRLRVLPPIEAPPGQHPEKIRDQVQAAMQLALDDLTLMAKKEPRRADLPR